MFSLRMTAENSFSDLSSVNPPVVPGFKRYWAGEVSDKESGRVTIMEVIYYSDDQDEEYVETEINKRIWNNVLLDLQNHLDEIEEIKAYNEQKRIMDKIRHDRNVARKQRYKEKYGNIDREKAKNEYLANKKSLEELESIIIEFQKSIVKNSDCPICYQYVHTQPCYIFQCLHTVCYDCSELIKIKRCPLCRSF
jgi:hypothetical protein